MLRRVAILAAFLPFGASAEVPEEPVDAAIAEYDINQVFRVLAPKERVGLFPGQVEDLGADYLLRIGIDNNLAITECRSADDSLGAEVLAEVCTFVREEATVRLARGYEMPVATGYANVHLQLFPRRRPVRPFAITENEGGIPLEVSAKDLGSARAQGKCRISGISLDRADEEELCRAWGRSLDLNRGILLPARRFKSGEAYKVYIEEDHSDGPVFTPAFHVLDQYRPTEAEFEPVVLDPALDFSDRKEQLRPKYPPFNYPSLALRREMQGAVTIATWLDESGRITHCRPLDSSGYAWLDGYACRSFLRWFRTDPVEPLPKGAYIISTMRWKLAE